MCIGRGSAQRTRKRRGKCRRGWHSGCHMNFLPKCIFTAFQMLFAQRKGMDPLTKEHWVHCCAEAGVDDLLGLGIKGDGCPCNWDRTRSLQLLSMNLPGLTREFKNLRIQCTCGNNGTQGSKGYPCDLMAWARWRSGLRQGTLAIL